MVLKPQVGVGVVVRDKDKILLLKRRNSHGEGTWASPGGHLEFGEELEKCAIRETEEETSLIIENVKFLGITNDFFEAENKHYITIWMESTKFKGFPKINSSREMSEIGWFNTDNLPNPLFLPFNKFIKGYYYCSLSRRLSSAVL